MNNFHEVVFVPVNNENEMPDHVPDVVVKSTTEAYPEIIPANILSNVHVFTEEELNKKLLYLINDYQWHNMDEPERKEAIDHFLKSHQ
jgi:hypothetical protein